jgi:hypothetical protein
VLDTVASAMDEFDPARTLAQATGAPPRALAVRG